MTESLAEQITQATTRQTVYHPNKVVAQQMQEKVLVMIVAPAAMGKSYLIKRAADSAPDLSQVSVFTTRQPRPDDDPGMFRCLLADEEIASLLHKIEAGEVVQYVIHPTHHTMYGSELRDYHSRYNLLAMLSGAVKTMRRLPFGNTITIGLITTPDTWQQRFDAKFPPNHPERVKRLQEAVLSLEWLTSQSDDTLKWLINNNGQEARTTEELVRICRGKNSSQQDGRQLALECLALARTMH